MYYSETKNTDALISLVFALMAVSFVTAFMSVMIGQNINTGPVVSTSFMLEMFEMAKRLIAISIITGGGSIATLIYGIVKALRM